EPVALAPASTMRASASRLSKVTSSARPAAASPPPARLRESAGRASSAAVMLEAPAWICAVHSANRGRTNNPCDGRIGQAPQIRYFGAGLTDLPHAPEPLDFGGHPTHVGTQRAQIPC